jgi:hypothetical protein
MNPKLKAISDEAAENLKAYCKEHEEKILEAWHSVEQEANENEESPKFKLGFAITLDLDKNTMENALTWSVRYKASGSMEIPDPNQPDLLPKPNPDDDTTVEISSGGVTSGPMPIETWNKAVRKISRKAK